MRTIINKMNLKTNPDEAINYLKEMHSSDYILNVYISDKFIELDMSDELKTTFVNHDNSLHIDEENFKNKYFKHGK